MGGLVQMPMPETRVQAANALTEAELLGTEPPFHAVNIFEVNVTNLDEFNAAMAKVREYYGNIPGMEPGPLYVADDGQRRRIVSINLYGEKLDRDRLREVVVDDHESVQVWLNALRTMERYELIATQQVG